MAAGVKVAATWNLCFSVTEFHKHCPSQIQLLSLLWSGWSCSAPHETIPWILLSRPVHLRLSALLLRAIVWHPGTHEEYIHCDWTTSTGQMLTMLSMARVTTPVHSLMWSLVGYRDVLKYLNELWDYLQPHPKPSGLSLHSCMNYSPRVCLIEIKCLATFHYCGVGHLVC